MDAKVIYRENEPEVSFNLFILNGLAVYEEKFINGGCVEPPGKVKWPYTLYEMVPKLKCSVFDLNSLNCD